MHNTYQKRMTTEGFELIDFAEDENTVFTAWSKNDKTVHVETYKKRTNDTDNYEVMTKYPDCWVGHNSFKSVIKEINDYINE